MGHRNRGLLLHFQQRLQNGTGSSEARLGAQLCLERMAVRVGGERGQRGTSVHPSVMQGRPRARARREAQPCTSHTACRFRPRTAWTLPQAKCPVTGGPGIRSVSPSALAVGGLVRQAPPADASWSSLRASAGWRPRGRRQPPQG